MPVDVSAVITIALSLWVIVGITTNVILPTSSSSTATSMNSDDDVSSSSSDNDGTSFRIVFDDASALFTFVADTDGDIVPLSFKMVLDELSNRPSASLMAAWLDFLEQEAARRAAFFWECVPTNAASLERTPFRFALVDSDALARISEDASSFAEHFPASRRTSAVFFENLGKDATLVAPVPLEGADFAHLASFTRTAPRDEQAAFWSLVAAQTKRRVSDNGKRPVWLSTSGLGVSFLHVRVCDAPKYYQTRALKTFA